MTRVFSRHWRLVAALVLCLLVLLIPEWLQIAAFLPPPGHRQAFGAVLLIALLSAVAVSRFYGFVLLVLISALQWADVLCFRYFGFYFRRRDFLLLTQESKDIFLGLGDSPDVWGWYFFGFVFSCFLIYGAKKTWVKPNGFGRWAAILLLVLPVVVVGSKEGWRTEPDDRNPVIVNALYAWGGFVVDRFSSPVSAAQAKWATYSVQQQGAVVAPSILLVVGESLNSSHMSVLGYDRPTTPKLSELLREYQGGYGEIVSAGISTRVSIPTFLNVVREPGNDRVMSLSPANLFRIARRRGLQTALLSVQELTGISSVIGKDAIQKWMDAVDHPIRDGLPPDASLVQRVVGSEVDLRHPFFMVLNTRSTHIPYELNYPHDFAYFSGGKQSVGVGGSRINAYDDAMRWFDLNVANAIRYVLRGVDQPVVVVVVSDHGQMLGKDGRFGHNVFDRDVYVTPYLWLVNDAATGYADVLRDCPLNHYELGKRLVGLMGFSVLNPNEGEREDVFWVNGTSLDGGNGVLKYSRSEWSNKLKCGESGAK